MKIIGVIPARYASSRFPAKPLALINGKPMIWWVYSHSKEVECFDEVYIATDNHEIENICHSFAAKVIITSSEHETATDRLYEVSKIIKADLFVLINGDEPVLTAKDIIKCIPQNIDTDSFYVSNLMTDFDNPVEVVDSSNLKIVTNDKGIALFISRSPIPYPKGKMDYVFHKFVGVGVFTNKALEYYHNTPRGTIEKIEENDSFRFIENQMPVYYINAHCKSMSVDNPKDIEIVEKYLTPQTVSKVQEAHKKGINMIEKHRILAFFTPFMLLKNSFNTIYPPPPVTVNQFIYCIFVFFYNSSQKRGL